MVEFMGTTICAVKKNGTTAIAGDGQVTMSQSVIFKNNAKKVRRIYNGKVIFGFAGSVAYAQRGGTCRTLAFGQSKKIRSDDDNRR